MSPSELQERVERLERVVAELEKRQQDGDAETQRRLHDLELAVTPPWKRRAHA